MTFRSKHISVSIDRSVDDVYEFASNPENLPRWAAGLSGSIDSINGDWIAGSPMGRVKVEFAVNNGFGILDHHVTLPSGETVYNPMRVFPNDAGSELVFTVYQWRRRRHKGPGDVEEAARAIAHLCSRRVSARRDCCARAGRKRQHAAQRLACARYPIRPARERPILTPCRSS
jgi:hypothetical protein